MMKNLLLFSLVLVMFFGIAGFALAGPIVSIPNPLCPGGTGSVGCIDTLSAVLTAITNYILGIVGVLVIAMFVWAGILFVTAGFQPGNYEKGKSALIYAVIGLAIILAASGLMALVTAVIGAPPAPGSVPLGGTCSAPVDCNATAPNCVSGICQL